MAVYAGQAKRRRTTGLVAVAAVVVGLIIGIVIGHATAKSLDDQIKDGRAGGRDLVTSLQVLPLEYGQALSGTEGTTQIGDTVDRAAAQLGDALDGAPWLGPAQRSQATQAVAAVKKAAADKVAPPAFQTVVDSSSKTLETVFGLPQSVG
ncbi:MAG TPA: hypothetical protein VL120_15495 [Solirubrobacteraceae bacterium]|jgi:hypothetical protein|nr:hypothetical protein [Solirubrobacteraceae bacterium]